MDAMYTKVGKQKLLTYFCVQSDQNLKKSFKQMSEQQSITKWMQTIQ